MNDIEFVIDFVRSEIKKKYIEISSTKDFANIVESVKSGLEANPDLDSTNVSRTHVLSAMGVQGPVIGYPNEECVKNLTRDLVDYCDKHYSSYTFNQTDPGESIDNPDNMHLEFQPILDLVAAFGCGWRRDLSQNRNWEGLWDGSFVYFTKRAERIARSIYFKLRDDLKIAFPHDDLVEPISRTAIELSTAIVFPTAPVSVENSFKISAGKQDGDPVLADLSVTTDTDWHEYIASGGRAVYQCMDGVAFDEANKIGIRKGDLIQLLGGEALSHISIRSPDGKSVNKKPVQGGSYLFAGGNISLDTWACTCSQATCETDHRIRNWDPNNRHYGKLPNFLYRAFQGEMNPIKAKSFKSSLLGAHWARHGWGNGSRLRMANVAHRVCLDDECVTPEKTVNVYWGSRCNSCGTQSTEKTPIVSRERLIVLGGVVPLWKIKEFWSCKKKCRPAGFAADDISHIEATYTVLTSLIYCNSCNEKFWPPEWNERLADIIESSKTRLHSLKQIHALQKGHVCQACSRPHTAQALCRLCNDDSGPESLNRSSIWLFDWIDIETVPYEVDYQGNEPGHVVDDNQGNTENEAGDYE